MKEAQDLTLLTQEIAALRQQIQHLENQVKSTSNSYPELPYSLIQLSENLCINQPLEVFCNTAVQTLYSLLGVDRAVVYRFHPDDRGEFIVEAKGTEWLSLLHLQGDRPEIAANISQCTLKYLHDLSANRSILAHPKQTRIKLFRVCNNIYTAGFTDCYLQVLQLYEAQAYAIAPLYRAGQLWGLLAVYQNQAPRDWQPNDLHYLCQVAIYIELFLKQDHFSQQISQQEQNIRRQLTQQIQFQQQEIRQEQRQQQALAEVIDTIRQTLDIKTVFAAAVRETRRFLQADRVAIYRFDPVSNHQLGCFIAEDLRGGLTSTLNVNVCDCCFAKDYTSQYTLGHVLQIDDIETAEMTDCHRAILQQFQIRANLLVPIFCNKELWGLYCIHQCESPRNWRSQEVQFIQKIAIQLGVALQQSKLYEEAQARTQELQAALSQVQLQNEQQLRLARQEQTIALIIDRIRNTLDIHTTLKTTTQEILALLHCDRATIYRFNPDWTGEFICESLTEGWQPLVVNNIGTVWRDDYLQRTKGGIFAKRKLSVVNDIYQVGYSTCHIELLETCQIRAYIIVPIFVGAKLWGLVSAYQNSGARAWLPWEIDLLKRLGDQLSVAIQQNELIARLRHASERAESANRAKSLFLANMSHELRTPLNAILGFTQVLRRQANLEPHQGKHLDIINRAGNHLLILLNDILTMSKIEADQIQLKTEYFELANMVAILNDIFQLQAQTKNIDFVLTVFPYDAPTYVSGDRGKLLQVLTNLLSNAFKFTHQGEVRLEIAVEAIAPQTLEDKPSALLSCKVIDTGVGIAAQDLAALFDPFVQTDEGKKVSEGTGLGLSIAQRFVELMGGTIEVSSELSRGSCFCFAVEVGIPEVPNLAVSNARSSMIAPGQPEYHILVVDAEAASRMALCYLLKSTGFQVQEVQTGQEAIAQLRNWQPHLIWLDLEIYDMNGYEVIRAIRTDLHNQTVKIIALTETLSDAHRESLNILGCDDYLTKPFADRQILHLLAKHLRVQYHCPLPNTGQESESNASPLSIQECIYRDYQTTDLPWRKKLRHAAIAARESQLSQLITAIQADAPDLSQHLQSLLKKLDFDAIVQLIDSIDVL